MTRELPTSAEIQQLDITAKDAVRLQREMSTTMPKEDSLRQKFEVATGREDPATQKRIEKATVGVLYNRPVKKPVFSIDGCPTWFNRLRAELERMTSSYLRTPNNFIRRRPGRCDQDRLQSKNYTSHWKSLITKNKSSFLRRLDDKVFLQLSQHPHGRQSPEYAVHLAQRDGRGDR